MRSGATTTEPSAAGSGRVYRCGTLTYTKAGLFSLFTWILWGDFCFTIMESVVPQVMPLRLAALKCPGWLMGLILTSIPNVLNMTVAPWVSFKSDRHRGPMGRRLPFIVWTIPFLTASLIALGYSADAAKWLQHVLPVLQSYAPATVLIGLLLVFMAIFSFFNMFVNSVFWYLFNDVVPRELIGRFSGMLRIAGKLGGMVYTYFIFRYSNTHFREVFLGAALLYFFSFGLMCWRVKEGEYPPLEGETEQAGKGFRGVVTFWKESFTHKFYWLIFLSSGLAYFAWAAAIFDTLFLIEMGLNVENNTIGQLLTFGGVASLPAMYVAAVFVDRWHPVRIWAYLAVFGVISQALPWVWVFVTLPPKVYFWFALGNRLSMTFYTALGAVASLPLGMRLFPKSRYGQFCSAQATFWSVIRIAGGVAAGVFVDIVMRFCPANHKTFAYRYIFSWCTFWVALATVFTVLVYRAWNRMGGDTRFHPPAPWSPKGVEEQPITKTVGPQTRCLNVALRLFDVIMGLSVLGILPMMEWMRYKHAFTARTWFGILLLPLAAMELGWWVWLRYGIRRDMERARRHERLRNGIPHHGPLIVVASTFILMLCVWMAQVLVTVAMGMDSAAIVFGVSNLVVNASLLGALQIMCRVERGYSTTIDVDTTPTLGA